MTSPVDASASAGTYGQAASFTVTAPANVAAGDLLILSVEAWNDSGESSITVSGGTTWAQLDPSRKQVWWKVAGSSEPASYTVTYSGAVNRPVIGIARITGADQTTPIDTYSSNTGSGTTATAKAVTPANAACLLFAIFNWYTGSISITLPGSLVSDWNVNSGTTTSGAGAAGHLAPSGSPTSDQTATLSGSTTWFGYQIAIAPAASGPNPVNATVALSPTTSTTQAKPLGVTAQRNATVPLSPTTSTTAAATVTVTAQANATVALSPTTGTSAAETIGVTAQRNVTVALAPTTGTAAAEPLELLAQRNTTVALLPTTGASQAQVIGVVIAGRFRNITVIAFRGPHGHTASNKGPHGHTASSKGPHGHRASSRGPHT